MTVRELLNHTSGIPGYTSLEQRWKQLRPFDVDPGQLLQLVEHEPLAFEPGSHFAYSNTGYVLLGLLIEATSGQSYSAYLRHTVLAPAGLHETFACPARRLVPHHALGYQLVDGLLQHAEYIDPSNAFAAGDLCSTARELVHWQRALFGGRVVGATALADLTTPARLTDGTSSNYGFGMRIGDLQGHRVFFHAGGISGFTSQLAYYRDDDIAIAVLTNIEGGLAGQVEAAVARFLLGLNPSPLAFGAP